MPGIDTYQTNERLDASVHRTPAPTAVDHKQVELSASEQKSLPHLLKGLGEFMAAKLNEDLALFTIECTMSVPEDNSEINFSITAKSL